MSLLSGSPRRRGATAQEAGLTVNRSLPADGRPKDALLILFVWIASVCLSLFVVPRHDDYSTSAMLYYSVYNVALGSLVGLYFFDRLADDGLALFALRGSAALLGGTLVNEAIVEPFIFGMEPINGEGVYYGLADAISSTGLFLLLRLAQWLRVLRQRVRPEPDVAGGPDAIGADADARCLFVRVAGGVRRIPAEDIVYLKADRDFTRIVCTNGEHFVSENLKSLTNRSAELPIVRVHKSFAVNLERVERLTRREVELGDCQVPVGRRYYQELSETWRVRPAESVAR